MTDAPKPSPTRIPPPPEPTHGTPPAGVEDEDLRHAEEVERSQDA